MPGRLAQWAGTGRGVDLIIYIRIMVSMIVVFNLHLDPLWGNPRGIVAWEGIASGPAFLAQH
jgi:hypothetical protein